MPTLPASAFNAFCDRGRGLGLVALHGGQAIALGHLLYTPDPFAGELALLVEDHWQGRRLGTALAGLLVDDAQDGGLTEVRGTVIAENHRTRRLLWRLGATIRPAAEPGLVEVRLMIERAPAV